MKFQKLHIIASIVCLLLGTSGVAMAQGCPDGRILFQTFPEGLIIDGEDCQISNVQVIGNLIVRNNAGNNFVDVLVRNSTVLGTIRILDIRSVAILGNEVSNGDIIIRGLEKITVGDNILRTTGPGQGGPVVGQQKILIRDSTDDTNGFVFRNEVPQGFIRCRPLEGPDVFAEANVALDVSCVGQLTN